MKSFKSLFLFGLIFISVFAQAQFSQKPLPYSKESLEPYIDAATMDIHYNKHHAAYVTNLNKALEGKTDAPKTIEELLANVSKCSPAVRNNGGGHFNHELFWSILSAEKSAPSSKLEKAINDAFGDVNAMKEAVNKAGQTQFGSGWSWLYVNSDGKLAVCSTPNQDNPLMDVCQCKGIPVLGIDVWEHAYYLKYQNKRADYLNNIWNIINWKQVSDNYEMAIKKISMK